MAKIVLGQTEIPLISSTIIRKLNPTITWGWPTLQTLVASELYEEVIGKRHRIYGYIKFRWSGGAQSQGANLELFTLTNIPLPKTPVICMAEIQSATDYKNGGAGDATFKTNGKFQCRTPYSWNDFNGWFEICNIEYSWVEE